MVCLSGKVGVGEAALGAAWMPFLADELLDGFNRQRSVLANHLRENPSSSMLLAVSSLFW